MTDRDYFAAAALTGMLAQGDDGSFSEASYARGAYRWADTMLCERSSTNLAEISIQSTDEERLAVEASSAASLRDWRSVHLARLHEVMGEAADEIERLRGRVVRLPDDLLIGHRLIKTALDEAGVQWVEVSE